MIPGYNNSTVPQGYDPFAVQYTDPYTGTAITSAGIYPYGSQTTATSDQWVTVYVAPAPPEDRESEDLKAFKKACARAALLADQRALRTLRDDPSPKIPLQARKGFSGRQAARKRVCAGSSRYRVLVN